jgi:hypothetical protein
MSKRSAHEIRVDFDAWGDNGRYGEGQKWKTRKQP